MNNWRKYSLEDLAFYYNGKAFKPSDWKKEGVKIIRIEQLNNPDGFYDFYQGEFAEINKVENGDLLFSWSATLKVLIWKHGNAVLNQHLFKVVPKQFVDKHFLFFLLDYNMEKIGDTSHGSTMKHIKRGELEKFFVQVPDKPEQRQIATILSTADGVIEKTQAAIDKYKAIKQGMLQDLFTRGIDTSTGKLRPSYQDAPELYKESKLGWIPKEWDEGKFIDFADENISHSFTGGPFGSDLQTRDYTETGVRIVQLQNIGDGFFKNTYKIYTSEEKANYLINCNIYAGEIIISKMADPIARACIMPKTDKRYLMASDGIRLAINKKKFNTRFVMETINHNRFRTIAELKAKGSTRPRIGLTELKEIIVVYPNKIEQNLIGERLDTIEAKIQTEQDFLHKQQQIKAALMHDLLSGRKKVIVKNN